MVGVHPMEDKPGFQVELAEHLVGGYSRLEKLAPPFLLRGRTFDLLFYYSLPFPRFAQCCGSRSFPNRLIIAFVPNSNIKSCIILV